MADRIIFVCILVLGGVYFWATSQIPTLEIGDPLGPKAFPRLLGVGLLFSGALLLFEMIKEGKNQSEKPKPDATDITQYKIIAGVAVVTGIFFALFETLGYVVSVSLYLLIMTSYFNRGKWMVNVLTAVLYGSLSYVMFDRLLGVNLPHGILPF